jgi:hypothetical protein
MNMDLRQFLVECKDPISIEKAKSLIASFSFEDHQSEIIQFLLTEVATESQKYILLDGLANTDLSSIQESTIASLYQKFYQDTNSVTRMLDDLCEEFSRARTTSE